MTKEKFTKGASYHSLSRSRVFFSSSRCRRKLLHTIILYLYSVLDIFDEKKKKKKSTTSCIIILYITDEKTLTSI